MSQGEDRERLDEKGLRPASPVLIGSVSRKRIEGLLELQLARGVVVLSISPASLRLREVSVTQHMPKVPENTSDPVHHTRNMSARFSELIEHLREDISRVDEPQFKAMAETAAEVMGALATAFKHYEQKRETAWKTQARN